MTAVFPTSYFNIDKLLRDLHAVGASRMKMLIVYRSVPNHYYVKQYTTVQTFGVTKCSYF